MEPFFEQKTNLFQASDMTEATDISEQSDIPLMSSVDASANNSTTLWQQVSLLFQELCKYVSKSVNTIS